MKISLKLPMVFEAETARHRNKVTVAVHSVHHRDIPDLHPSEAPVVLEFGTDGIRHDESDMLAQRPLVIPGGNTPFAFREYDGRLYRRLRGVAEQRFEDEVDVDPYPDLPRCSPIGKPIRMHFEHRHFILGRGNIYRTWPPEEASRGPNETSFEDIRPLLTRISENSLGICREMQEKRMDGLISIGGETWMETSPPCVMVSVRHPHKYGIYGMPQTITLRNAFLPEWHDRRATTRYFQLDDIDGAMEYVDALGNLYPGSKSDVIDYRALANDDLTSAMRFDGTEEFQRRLLVCLALDRANNQHLSEIGTAERDTHPIHQAFHDALNDNLVTGKRADMGRYADFLLTDRAAVDFFTRNRDLSNVRSRRAVDRFLSYSLELFENQAITLTTNRIFSK